MYLIISLSSLQYCKRWWEFLRKHCDSDKPLDSKGIFIFYSSWHSWKKLQNIIFKSLFTIIDLWYLKFDEDICWDWNCNVQFEALSIKLKTLVSLVRLDWNDTVLVLVEQLRVIDGVVNNKDCHCRKVINNGGTLNTSQYFHG